MKKFEYIKEKTYRCFQFPNGKLVDVFSCKYGCKVDLLNESYIPYENSKEYNESRLPTIEDLILNESVKVVSCIEKEYSINFPSKVKRLYKKDFQSIIDEFAENGFNVSIEAITHNYNCWRGDLKSGFRDEENGYHLFTPCGCNPLSFRISTLHPKCNDWQITYEC